MSLVALFGLGGVLRRIVGRVSASHREVEREHEQLSVVIARDRRDVERAQPVVHLRARDRGDHLAVELLGEDAEATANIVQVPLRNAVGFFRFEKFSDELLRRARLLARFQMRDVILNGVGDRSAERLQLLDCVLRHDAQRRWKLRVLDAVAFQLGVLECGE